MRSLLRCLISLLLSLSVILPASSWADETQTLEGVVIDVIDGDSIRVKSLGGNRFKVQLEGVVAPFSKESILGLREWIMNQPVRLEWRRRDKWKRLVAQLYLGERNINLALVEAGLAWFYTPGEYPLALRAEFEAAEKKARLGRRGLWAGEETRPPWER